MKYYSELTKKPYDTVEDLERAERAIKEASIAEEKKRSERAEAAKEVEIAFDEARKAISASNKAKKNAQEKLNEFCKKYGPFHTSYKGWSDILDDIFSGFIL